MRRGHRLDDVKRYTPRQAFAFLMISEDVEQKERAVNLQSVGTRRAGRRQEDQEGLASCVGTTDRMGLKLQFSGDGARRIRARADGDRHRDQGSGRRRGQ